MLIEWKPENPKLLVFITTVLKGHGLVLENQAFLDVEDKVMLNLFEVNIVSLLFFKDYVLRNSWNFQDDLITCCCINVNYLVV